LQCCYLTHQHHRRLNRLRLLLLVLTSYHRHRRLLGLLMFQ
jgi:hypothetical protein